MTSLEGAPVTPNLTLDICQDITTPAGTGAGFPLANPSWTSSALLSENDDVSDSPSPERPLIPTNSADWEAKKEVIKELYMTQNLILNDVMQIMVSEHRFKATYAKPASAIMRLC